MNWDDPEAIKELAFRQKPGAGNALGHVKFLFPNPHDVYLHDTPADALFFREGRALSHGCIRLEMPEELARYMLRDKPEWTDDKIKEAMHSGEETARRAEGKGAGPHRVFHGVAEGRRRRARCSTTSMATTPSSSRPGEP